MMILNWGVGVVFNLVAVVLNVNSLVVEGYDPFYLFFGLLSSILMLFAFGMLFKETCLWIEGLRRDLK